MRKKGFIFLCIICVFAFALLAGCGAKNNQPMTSSNQEVTMKNQDVQDVRDIEWGEYEDGGSGIPEFLEQTEEVADEANN